MNGPLDPDDLDRLRAMDGGSAFLVDRDTGETTPPAMVSVPSALLPDEDDDDLDDGHDPDPAT